MFTRRQVLRTAAFAGASTAFGGLMPAWATSGRDLALRNPEALSGTEFDLDIGPSRAMIDGREGQAITINGSIPAPLLRFREGDTVTLNVTNRLHADTSIHWHGLLLPPDMDGVPGVSFPGIKPGTTFQYRYPVRQAGTYWFHSHSGLQEQSGHYGPLVIDPAGADPVEFDREYVIVLSDWTFENPHRVFAKLKKMSDTYNFQKRTVRDFFRDASNKGLGRALEESRMWGSMRMDPTDIADVTGATYTFLINGHGPQDNWTALFVPGERVRLRFINAAAMSIFNVRIPGLPMTVVQSDGLNVRPIEVDEFQIGTAETYDVVVTPEEHQAFTLVAESIDRSGLARATLAPEMGMTAEVPPLRERPLLTMKDMGMSHDGMGHGDMGHGEMGHSGMGSGTGSMTSGGSGSSETMEVEPATGEQGALDGGALDHGAMDHGAMDHGAMDHAAMGHGSEDSEEPVKAMDHGSMDHGVMDHGAMDHGTMDHGLGGAGERGKAPMSDLPHETTAAKPVKQGPGVANLAEAPQNRLHERGVGLENVPHRVLVYSDLESLEPNPDLRPPSRELELHLTSNMDRYMWSFDGMKLSENPGPIVFYEGERLRLTMVNDTMMPHPIHLHGMFFELVTGRGDHLPRKHTVVVKPGEILSVDVTADAVGNWAFHCHLLYHMFAGMMRVVSVLPKGQETPS